MALTVLDFAPTPNDNSYDSKTSRIALGNYSPRAVATLFYVHTCTIQQQQCLKGLNEQDGLCNLV